MMVGACASGGSNRTIVDTRSRTSWAAVSMLRFRLNVGKTPELPWPDCDRNSARPSTVLTASSTTCVMETSSSSGEAPGRNVRTWIIGSSTSGCLSTSRWKYATAPTTTRNSTIIDAKTGRRIQSSASLCTFQLLGIDDDFFAVDHVAWTEYDLFSGVQTFNNLDTLFDTPAGFDAGFRSFVTFEYKDPIDSRECHDGGRRQQQCALAGRKGQR